MLLEVANMPATRTLHEAVDVGLLTITPRVISEGKTLIYSNHDLPAVERRGQEAKKFIGKGLKWTWNYASYGPVISHEAMQRSL